MVDYTEQEKMLVAKCVGLYKREVLPDVDIDRNDPKIHIAAVDYCHSLGRFIRNEKQHALKDAILEKNGIEVESNAVRQVRLKKERFEAIHGKRVDTAAAIEEEKRAELKVAADNKKKIEAELKAIKEEEKNISAKEARAKAAQEKAEQIAKEQADEIARLKEELAKKSDKNYLTEAMDELKKGEDAEIVKEPEKVVELKEPPETIVEPPVVEKKEKTVEELMEDLKTE